ncbi:hypothetical protein RNJ44_03877 [Nakaseomyces bracarensis]|uniref:TLC domain-containing protein n=1 Tax=Nakaseomyces bracarensis TaxID=273131 RepID=A0ABR4NY71_9SACH
MDFKTLLESSLEIPSPQWFQDYVVVFLKEHNIVSSEAILENLHSVLYVALAYQLWYLLALKFLFPPFTKWRLNHSKNPDDKKKAKSLNIQAAIHFVSLLQSLVVVYLSLVFLGNKEKAVIPYQDVESRIFGRCRDTEVITIYAIGYFVWDMYISAMHSTLPFVLHGIISTAVFVIGLKPYIQYYAPVFLMFELSNPFLNFRWFGLKYLPTENRICGIFLLVNNLVLLFLFFGARIAWGWYQIGRLTWDFYTVRHDDRFLLLDSTIIVGGNLILDILNAVWFSTMLSVAINTIKRKPKTE